MAAFAKCCRGPLRRDSIEERCLEIEAGHDGVDVNPCEGRWSGNLQPVVIAREVKRLLGVFSRVRSQRRVIPPGFESVCEVSGSSNVV